MTWLEAILRTVLYSVYVSNSIFLVLVFVYTLIDLPTERNFF